jgi:hypothetical protein
VTAFWRVASAGVTVAVKVQPKARRPGLLGAAPTVDGLRLRIAVSEPPEDGCANRAVCAALAGALHVAPSAVTVTAGAGTREKLLFVSGDPAVLARLLAAL